MNADTNQKVGLGCGTLILIALIVMIFGNSGSRGLEQEVAKLGRQVQTLETAVQAQTETLQSIRSELQQLRATPATPESGQ